MPRDKVTLLDRAKGDLLIAETMLNMLSDNGVVVDACAYHCQQCVEKVAKYLIVLQGETYSPSHDSDEYLIDLAEGETKELIKNISNRIDRWSNTIRYSHTLLSNKNAVADVIKVCKKLIDLAVAQTPIKTELKKENGINKINDDHN